MIKLFARLARSPRRPLKPQVADRLEFDRRDWADLPIHHPRSDS